MRSSMLVVAFFLMGLGPGFILPAKMIYLGFNDIAEFYRLP